MKAVLRTILFGIILSFAGCSSGKKLNSFWSDGNITIDGKHDDWQTHTYYFENEDVSVGILNDDEFLYLSFITSNQATIRQFMAMGFTTWIDPDGGKDKYFGIRYPVGLASPGRDIRPGGRVEKGRPDMDALKQEFQATLNEVEVIVPGENDPIRITTTEVQGIELKISDPSDLLVYELKIPLKNIQNLPYLISFQDSKKIGIGFETEKIDFEKMGKRGGFSGRPGGMSGPPGGGRRGGMNGRMGGHGFQPPEQFKLWISVSLEVRQ